MSSIFIWFIGVLVCGLGLSIMIAGVSFHSSAVIDFFNKKFLDGIICTILALVFDAVGFLIFGGGYMIFRSCI